LHRLKRLLWEDPGALRLPGLHAEPGSPDKAEGRIREHCAAGRTFGYPRPGRIPWSDAYGRTRVRSAYPGHTPSRVARRRPKVASGNTARPGVPSGTHVPAASPEATLMGGPGCAPLTRATRRAG